MNYLTSRGVSPSAIQTFKLGWAPFEWDGLLKTLTKQGYPLLVLIKANLIQPSTSPSGGYDRFRGRVIFPLNDPRGQTLGFAGRILPPEFVPANIEVKESAKYVNTSETEVFHKRQLLYALDVNKTAIRASSRAIIVEGELDAIASWQAGVPEVVAIKGSSLTEEQVQVLKRYTETVILALDMDLAGDQAARRGIQVAEEAGLEVRLIRLTGGKDPAEIAQTDPENWKKLLQSSLEIYEFLLISAIERHTTATATAKRKIVAELVPIWRHISSRVVQAHWVAELARRLTLPESVIWQEVGAVHAHNFQPRPSSTPATNSQSAHRSFSEGGLPATTSRRQQLEELLIGKLLLNNPRQLLDNRVIELLTLPWVQRLISTIQTAADHLLDGELELTQLSLPVELQTVVAQAMMQVDRHDDPKVTPTRLLKELTIIHLQEHRHQLHQLLTNAEQQPAQDDTLNNLQKQINTLNLQLAQLGTEKV